MAKMKSPGGAMGGASGASESDLLGSNRSENTNPTDTRQDRTAHRAMPSGTANDNHGGHDGTKPLGPFGACAAALTAWGLVVIPVGGDDGKKPMVNWRNWLNSPGPLALAKMCSKFATANVGVITGLSRLTVVDCDAPEAVTAMIERCGDTPLSVRTPSGGVHLYYRSNGERCANLRSEGLVVDVKGIGGFVVAPPSVRPSGPHAGCSYRFYSGSWADLGNLPTARQDSLTIGASRDTSQPTRLCAVKEGYRNNMLFRALLRHAAHCDSPDDLQDVANTINDDYVPPLPPAEVEKAVRSAWRYEQEGNNWVGREARTLLTASEHQIVAAHRHGPDALLLLTWLRLSHGTRGMFCVAPKAMAHAKVFPGWGPQRYRNAAATLVQIGRLRIIHRGGRCGGDARRYAFAKMKLLPRGAANQGE